MNILTLVIGHNIELRLSLGCVCCAEQVTMQSIGQPAVPEAEWTRTSQCGGVRSRSPSTRASNCDFEAMCFSRVLGELCNTSVNQGLIAIIAVSWWATATGPLAMVTSG